jgi:hypothetical protein
MMRTRLRWCASRVAWISGTVCTPGQNSLSFPKGARSIMAAGRAPAGLEPPDEQPFLPRLSGAGSLRRELEQVLAVAEPDASLSRYRELILDRNAAGKSSASMRSWTWKRLKNRYLLDPRVPEFTAFRSCMDRAHAPGDRGLLAFLMMARTDRLFREVVTATVSPHLDTGGVLITAEAVDGAVRSIAERTNAAWTESSMKGVVSHLLSSCKDFGIVTGSATKRTVRTRPGALVTEFAVRLARLEGLTDRQVLRSRWFMVLGVSYERVLDLMYEASQAGVLDFRFQADIAEITLAGEVA